MNPKYFEITNQQIIELFWPLNIKNDYFNVFEKKFYEILCKDQLKIFPIVYKDKHFADFNSSLFIDFNFEQIDIQNLCIKIFNLNL